MSALGFAQPPISLPTPCPASERGTPTMASSGATPVTVFCAACANISLRGIPKPNGEEQVVDCRWTPNSAERRRARN